MSTPGEHGTMVLLTRLSRTVHRAAKEDTLGMTFKQYATLDSGRRNPGRMGDGGETDATDKRSLATRTA